MKDWELKLDDIFGKKAPPLPQNVKEMIVKYGPYITLVLLILTLPAILALFGLGTFLAPLALMGGAGTYASFSLTMILTLIAVALEIMALPHLFKRSMQGWRLMFYAALVAALSSLLSLNLMSLLVGTAISFYFLFQIKPLYK